MWANAEYFLTKSVGQHQSDEKRKRKRYKAVDGAVASFSAHGAPAPNILGEIIDISINGLSVRYKSREQAGDISQIDIFAYKEPFINLSGMPCQLIYDIGLDATTRRCGVEFGELSESQLAILSDFITHYTEGEAC